MKKLLIASATALIFGSCASATAGQAKWKMFRGADVDISIDENNIKKKLNTRSLWMAMSSVNERSKLLEQSLVDIDCNNTTITTKYLVSYAVPNSDGPVAVNERELAQAGSSTIPVPPVSLLSTIVEYVCSKWIW